MKLSVVHLTFASRSGVALYAFRLAKAIAEEGGTVTLVCPTDFLYLEPLRNCTRVRVRPVIPAIETRSILGYMFGMLQQTWAALVELWRVCPEPSRIVHVTTTHLPVVVLPLLWVLRLRGWKVVLTVHDVLPHRWLMPRSLRWFEWSTYWLLYHSVAHLVVHDSSQERDLGVVFQIPGCKMSIIPHGPFDLAEEALGFVPASEMCVLMFGVIRRNKGVHLAIDAVRQLRSEGWPIRLRIAGKPYASEARYWEQCKQLVASSPDGIEIVEGYIPDSNLPKLFAESHAVLLPYLEFHSQSGVALMAMANGRAVIATGVGGLSELVRPYKTGILIREKSVDGVKRALLDALALYPDELERIGSTARAFVRQQYSWRIVAIKHLELYKKLVEAPK